MPPLLAESRPTAHEYRSVSSLLSNWDEASWLRYGHYVLSVNRCVVGSGRHGGRLNSRVLLRPAAPRDLGHPEGDRDGGLAGRTGLELPGHIKLKRPTLSSAHRL